MKSLARAQFSDPLALRIKVPKPFRETVVVATVVALFALLLSSRLGLLFGLLAFEGIMRWW